MNNPCPYCGQYAHDGSRPCEVETVFTQLGRRGGGSSQDYLEEEKERMRKARQIVSKKRTTNIGGHFYE